MTMSRPLVSILTAAYRSRPDHIASAIESALGQTWREIEVIVSDDSPRPDLQPLVERYGDPRLRYVHHAPALGVARNHAWCIGASRGEFVAILNHDDRLEPAFLETMMAPLVEDPDIAVAFCDHWVIDEAGEQLLQHSDEVSKQWGRSTLAAGAHRPFLHLLAAQTVPLAMGAVFRKSHLRAPLPADAGPAYDLWLTYALARDGQAAHYVPERLSAWRAHASNLTAAAGTDWLLGAARCWQAIAADERCAAIRDEASRKAAAAIRTCALSAVRAGRPQLARALALEALRADPRPADAAIGLLACLPAAWSRPIAMAARRRQR